ncbi:MAG TPA: GNAT family N-acetyltransferase [Geminicoccaceae bacterium]|nr:GNAT family N-acetyltransferase [Geminicoccaceae bacterium]
MSKSRPVRSGAAAPRIPDADLQLVRFTRADLPLVEPMVRAYYLEDGHGFDEERQPRALAALADGDQLGCGWLIALAGRPIGYLVLTLGFSVEAGGAEGCIDEFYLVPAVRGLGLGGRALELVEAEARRLAVRRLFLEVEHGNRALNLYRRAGYVDHRRFLMSKFLDR